MKIKGQRDYLANLESVAMTDIVLNMFIFFFISFSLIYTFSPGKVKHLDVRLPNAASAAPAKNTDQVNITITNEGLVYLDNEKVTEKELKKRMYFIHKTNPGLSVVLSVDRRVQFNNVVHTLDILNELGIKNLNIAAKTQEQ